MTRDRVRRAGRRWSTTKELDRAAASTRRLLAALPVPGARSEGQAALAARVKDDLREQRERHLAEHTAGVYARVARGRRLRLRGLMRAARVACPSLVPTVAETVEDRARPQAVKEGHEIDDAVFLRAMLRAPEIGGQLCETALEPTARALGLLADFSGTGTADLGHVTVERRGEVAYLTLCRTDRLNAEDEDQVDDLETAIDLALLEPRVRAGVVRGGVMTHPKYRGRRVFCAGIDLKALSAGRITLVDFILRREMGGVRKLMLGLRRPGQDGRGAGGSGGLTVHGKPFAAAVDGFAIGGGAQLLLAFDHVVAAADAYVSLPAAQEGIVPGLADLRLSRWLGPRGARRLILQGQRIRATDPDARLLLDEVVAPEDFDAAADKCAEGLLGPAVPANRRMLALAEEPEDRFRSYLAEFAVEQAVRMHSADVVDKTARFAGVEQVQ